jgi:phosphate transport system substrate-binding protein
VAAQAEKINVDAKIKKYTPAAGVAGNLGSIGSDSLNNLMTYWAEGFKKKYPESTSRSKARVPAPHRLL